MKNISFVQIFTFFNLKLTEEASFCSIYQNENYRFLIFSNAEDDNKISCYCMQTAEMISKQDTVLLLASEILSSKEEIAKIPATVKFNESATPEQAAMFCRKKIILKDGLINGCPVSILENYLELYSLFGTEKIGLDLYLKTKISNYIEFSPGSAASFFDTEGYAFSKITDDISAVLFAADPLAVFPIYTDRFVHAYLSVFMSDKISISTFYQMFDEIPAGIKDNLPFKIAVKSDRSYTAAMHIFSAYISYFKQLPAFYTDGPVASFSLHGKINPVHLGNFINDINVKVYKMLGIAEEDHEKKAASERYKFSILKTNGLITISFLKSNWMIRLLLPALAALLEADKFSFYFPGDVNPDLKETASADQKSVEKPFQL